MAYTQKGFSMHSGTSRHASALKAHAKSNKPEMSQNPTHSGLNDGNNDFKSDKDSYDKAMDAPSKFLKESTVKQTKEFNQANQNKEELENIEKANKEGKAVKIERLPLEPLEVKEDYNRGLSKSGQDQREALIKDIGNKKVDGGSKEGKGKNLFGKMGDGIKKIANKINEHGKKVGKDGNSGWDHLLHAMNEPISLTASGIKPPVSGRKTKEKNKEHDPNDPQNKLEEPQKQNDVLGANSGSKSSSKTSNEAQIELDNARIEEEGNKVTKKMEEKFPNTYGKPGTGNDPIYIKYLESKTKK